MRMRILAGPAVAVIAVTVLGALLWLALAHAQWSSSRASSGAVNSWTASGDFDGDDIPDGSDNCPAWPNADQSLPPWSIPSDDPDCDGFTTADENSIGTNPNLACGTDAWPPDFDDSQTVNILDVGEIRLVFHTTVPPTSPRFDLKPDGDINILDVGELRLFYNLSCTP